MKIGDIVSYTFIHKQIMVDSKCIYEETFPVTIEAMVIAYWGDDAYLKTTEGTIKVRKCLLTEKPQS